MRSPCPISLRTDILPLSLWVMTEPHPRPGWRSKNAIRASSCPLVTGFISMAGPNPDERNFWSRLEERLEGLPSILPDEEGIAKIVTGITIPRSVRDSQDQGDWRIGIGGCSRKTLMARSPSESANAHVPPLSFSACATRSLRK